MALADELGKGKQAIEAAIQALNKLGSEAELSFSSIAGNVSSLITQVQNLATANAQNAATYKDVDAALKRSTKSITDLKKGAQELKKFNSDQLKDSKEIRKVVQKRVQTQKDLVAVQQDLAKNQALTDEARALGDQALEKALIRQRTLLIDAQIEAQQVLGGLSEIADVNEKISQETGFFDRLAEGIKDIPGLGPLLAKPIQDASKAYRAMRLKEGSTQLQAMAEGAKGLADSFGPAFLLGLLFKADQRTTSLAKSLQISKEEAINVKHQFNFIANASGKAFLNQENLTKATAELVDHLGVAKGISEEMLKSQTFLTKQLGLSAQEAGMFNEFTELTGTNQKEAQIQIADQVKLLEKETGIQLKLNKVVASVAKAHAGLKAAYGFEVKEIAKQVVLTQKLGLEVEQTAKMASQLLDFESSIAKELEAELLTGKDLNLEQARFLALQGKSTEAAAELAKQVGGSEELTRMNVLQQEALAEAMGMERNELIQSVQKREVMARLGVRNIEQLAEQNRLEELKGNALGEQLLAQYEQESAAARFEAAVIKIQDTFATMMEGGFGKFLNGMASLANSAGVIYTIMGAIAVMSLSRVIGQLGAMLAVNSANAAAALTTISAITFGIGLIAVLAAVGVGLATMNSEAQKSANNMRQVNDARMQGNVLQPMATGTMVQTNKEDEITISNPNRRQRRQERREEMGGSKIELLLEKIFNKKDPPPQVNLAMAPGANTFNIIQEDQNVQNFDIG